MTQAVCLSCGEFKIGALTTCPNCGHHPITLDDRAAHFICCDQLNTLEDLKSISQRIKSGETIQFNPEHISQIKSLIADMQDNMMGQ